MARITILGNSGTGKSYYAGYLLEQSVPEFDYAIHFDPADEEQGLSDEDHDPIYKEIPVDRERAREAHWPRVIYNMPARIVPERLTQDEQRQLYARLCAVVMKLCKDATPDATALVSCDEAHRLLPQSSFPPAVERLITGGRKHGVECMHISQRPQSLHSTVISLADRRIYFGTHDDNDIGKIDKTATFDAQKLQQIPARTCYIENKDSGEFEKLNTDNIEREHPHYADDDGILEDKLSV